MTNGIGRGWWAPPKGDHVGKLRLNDKGRVLFNKATNATATNFPEITKDYYEWGAKHYASQLNNLTDKEVKVMTNYCLGETYGDLLHEKIGGGNDYVRGMLSNAMPIIKIIDSAISKGTIPHNIKLFRGGKFQNYETLKVGDSFVDTGFASTSLERDMAEDWGETIQVGDWKREGAVFIINAKEGQKGLYVGNAEFNTEFNEKSGSTAQRELILPRNCVFKIKKISKKKKFVEIEVDLIEQKEQND